MILKYMLPKSYEERIVLSDDASGKERIYYSVPVDIDSDGKWTNNSFFVVTTKKIYTKRRRYPGI